MASRAIGIDLGTTFSCVAVWDEGQNRVTVIENEQGNRTTPSVVAFAGQERLVGEAAACQGLRNAANTVFDIKRFIGRKFTDAEVKADSKRVPFRVVLDANDRPQVQIQTEGPGHRSFSTEELSAMVLGHLKGTAEAFLGARVEEAVITVPAYFTDAQRQATKDAGEIAGLRVLRLLNEPTAAGLAYGLDRKDSVVDRGHGVWSKRLVLVFDWGGGTLDVSLLRIRRGEEFEVVAVAGDSRLGGGDLDIALADFLAQEFQKQYKTEVSKKSKAYKRLRTAAERAKRVLSSCLEITVEVDSLQDGFDFSFRMTRSRFESINRQHFDKAIDVVKSCLKSAGREKDDLDELVLVGGSSRIPKIQAMLQALFNGKQLCKSINPDEAVAQGAAIQAAMLSTASPTSNGSLANFVLTDVTPLSLGTGMLGDILAVVIPKNTPLPASGESSFTTTEDFQTEADFDIYEGERPIASKNHILGTLKFHGITPALRGVSFVTCTMAVGLDGILTVEVADEKSGKEHCMVIRSGQLGKAEIERMKAEAKTFEKEDKRRKRAALARNQLEDCLLTICSKLKSKETFRGVKVAEKQQLARAMAGAEQLLNRTKKEPAETKEYKKQLKVLKVSFLPMDWDGTVCVEDFFSGMRLGGNDSSESEDFDPLVF